MNKHTATYLDQVFTRNSKGRVYTHTVVARRSEENALEYASSLHPVDASNWLYYCGTKPYVTWDGKPDTLTIGDDVYHSGAEFKADFPTAESYQEYERDCRLARLEREKAAGEFDTYVNQGWCGRRDLAVKLLDKTLANGYWDHAVILDAEVN